MQHIDTAPTEPVVKGSFFLAFLKSLRTQIDTDPVISVQFLELLEQGFRRIMVSHVNNQDAIFKVRDDMSAANSVSEITESFVSRRKTVRDWLAGTEPAPDIETFAKWLDATILDFEVLERLYIEVNVLLRV